MDIFENYHSWIWARLEKGMFESRHFGKRPFSIFSIFRESSFSKIVYLEFCHFRKWHALIAAPFKTAMLEIYHFRTWTFRKWRIEQLINLILMMCTNSYSTSQQWTLLKRPSLKLDVFTMCRNWCVSKVIFGNRWTHITS